MNTFQNANAEERMESILRSSTWGYNFLVFGLLADIMCRSVFYHEPSWDIFALLGIAGIISLAYRAKHNVPVGGWKIVTIMGIGGLAAAILAGVNA